MGYNATIRNVWISHAGKLYGYSEPALKPRSNWWTFEMFAELSGQEMLPALEVGNGCVGIVRRTLCNQSLVVVVNNDCTCDLVGDLIFNHATLFRLMVSLQLQPLAMV